VKQLRGHGLKLTLLAAGLSLAGCGGGTGGTNGGLLQVITFDYPGGVTLAAGPATLKATATSGLPVSFKSGTPTICTVSGDQLTVSAEGECLIYADQAGGKGPDGAIWAPAQQTDQLFKVLKHAQVVTFTPPDYVLSAATKSVTLSASADTGLPMTFSTTTPAVCSISGSTLTLMSKGSCAVTATQAGNETYAATSTQRFIAVDPLLIADGFKPANSTVRGTSSSLQTKQDGGVLVNPWGSPLGAGWEWCDANSGGDWCYATVSADGSALTSALDLPESKWSPGGWQYSFNRVEIFAPGKTGFNGSGDTTGGLRVSTEKVLGFTLGMNAGLFAAGKPVVVHLDLGKRNGDCNVTLSTQIWAPQSGLISYGVPLDNFAVTQGCGISGVTSASLDNDVRKLPNPYNNKGEMSSEGQAAFKAALDSMAASRASAATLLQSSDIVRVRFYLMDVNTDKKTSGMYASDLTLKGAITIQ